MQLMQVNDARSQLADQRIRRLRQTMSPDVMLADMQPTERQAQTVLDARRTVEAILRGDDSRYLVVVGPCSIHDMAAAKDYAVRLRGLADEISSTMVPVMRVYVQKPRTNVGWPGFVTDPDRDGSYNLDKGRRLSRELLLYLAELGLPAATEFLDSTAPQFISDLITWAAIGARTVETPALRHMASGLSMPVGFKNSTGGDVMAAVNAMMAAADPHTFAGVDEHGLEALFETTGNDMTHVVLRGGADGPNYSREHIDAACELLSSKGMRPGVMIDASHANAQGDYLNQLDVCRDVVETARVAPSTVIGLMIESNLEPGKQAIGAAELAPGVSITDPCLGWDQTAQLLRELHRTLSN